MIFIMGSPEGQPGGFEKKESPELPTDITQQIDERVEQSEGFLLQSRGILERVARESYEKFGEGDNGEDDVIDGVLGAVDRKIEELRERSRGRFEQSDITDSEKEELNRKNPRRSSTRFRGLKH